MKVEALKSFSGKMLSMHKGEVKECSDKTALEDLLRCGYVKKVTGGVKKNESKRD